MNIHLPFPPHGNWFGEGSLSFISSEFLGAFMAGISSFCQNPEYNRRSLPPRAGSYTGTYICKNSPSCTLRSCGCLVCTGDSVQKVKVRRWVNSFSPLKVCFKWGAFSSLLRMSLYPLAGPEHIPDTVPGPTNNNESEEPCLGHLLSGRRSWG